MLDFKELSDNGEGFELLIRELLFSLGLKVYWSGRGADGGRDLLCIEESKSIFMSTRKRWLIQCKHKARSGNSVGTTDLDDIIGSCMQHQCDAYLLATSTQPSSAVVTRLEQITANPTNQIIATIWDSVEIERRLRTPQQWPIAQHFFPTSANGWKIYASERPNHWTANFNGHYLHLSNRIGSDCSFYLNNIEDKLKIIDSLPYLDKHFIRLRGVYFDDKHGTFTWYIDYMHPHDSSADISPEEIEIMLNGDSNDNFDIKIRKYLEYSDHYDKDHYDYYDRYMGQFILGLPRIGRG
ncbi:MAG: restriction endonuclease [Burkholderiales bacterium]|nr:restriction endonuclease [Burkholderiales bacterium]